MPRCNSKGTATMAIQHRLEISFMIIMLMSSRRPRAWVTPCQKACTSHFVMLLPKTVNRKPSQSMVALFPRRRMCAIETRKCTSKSQETCLRSSLFAANKKQSIQYLKGHRPVTLPRIGTSAPTTMSGSMERLSFKNMRSSTRSQQALKGISRLHQKVLRTWNRRATLPNSSDTRPRTSRSILSPCHNPLNQTSQAGQLKSRALAIYENWTSS